MDPRYSLSDDQDIIISEMEGDYQMRVKDLPDENRPREKLMQGGPEMLSTSELLSVVLGSGTKREEISHMTKRILREYGDKNISNYRNPKALSSDMEIPIVKACQIVSCFELGRRFFGSGKGSQVIIRNAKSAYHYLKGMQSLSKEQIRGLYLNSRYRLIHDEVISVGSLTSSIIHPREVFRPAIECSAAAIIMAHNHPSGSPKPTKGDIEATEQLIEAGKILGIQILDHIVIGKGSYNSVPAGYK
jgi:DNA repair protein RadC